MNEQTQAAPDVAQQQCITIPPTPGRVVWYYPYSTSDGSIVPADNGQPLAAIVARVWSDTCVNLAIFDASGNHHSRTSVLLVQPGNPRPDHGFCEWMPYQIGQAKRG